jgi:hypothetical protein
MLTDLLNRPFHLLDRFKNRIILILVIGSFVILFVNLYLPFNIDSWFKSDSVPLFITLSGFGVITMVGLSVSQLIIRELFAVRQLSVAGTLLWFFVELLLLTLTMFFIYGDLELKGIALFNELLLSFRYTLLVLVLPYAGVLFYLYTVNKSERNQADVKSENRLIKIYDENRELHMAIDFDRLLFIRSADNYVEICFLKDGRVSKELVRTTLKRLESELADFPVRRCHRSYMVNINQIAVSVKSERGFELTLRHYTSENIPVSRNFKPFFIRLMKENKG